MSSPDSIAGLLPERYRLLRPLGRGGQGAVFLVEDLLRGGEELVLKLSLLVPGNRGADSSALQAEFETLTKLVHPSLAAVRDFGRIEGAEGAYFTAEYVPGPNLLRWFADRGDEREAARALLRLAAQALGALAALERAGVRHGDVKPAHLIVEEAGGDQEGPARLRLIDFGSSFLSTASGAKVRHGTPGYRVGSAAVASGELPVDLAGLGASLYHVLTGRFPAAETGGASAISPRGSGEGLDLAGEEERIPRPLAELVRRLTGGTRGDGFRSAAQALRFVTRATELEAIPPRPARWTTRLHGRDALLRRCLGRLEQARGGVLVIESPPGGGKSRLLEALAQWVELRGWTATLLESPRDGLVLDSLLPARQTDRWSRRGWELGAPRRSLGAIDVLAGLERKRLLLVDDADQQEPPVLLAELARHAAAGFRGGTDGRRLACVLAAREPARALGAFGLAAEDVWRIALPGLERPAVEAIAADHFAVSAVPPRVAEWLHERTDGLPADLLRALGGLEREGAFVDFLGLLRVRYPLPRRLEPREEGWIERSLERLRPSALRCLRRLAALGTSVSAEDLAAFWPERTVRQWASDLEDLVRRRLARAVVARGTRARFALAGELAHPANLARVGRPAPDEIEAALRRAAARESGGIFASSPARSGVIGLWLALGRLAAAARGALRAARRALKTGRAHEAHGVLARVVEASPDGPGPWLELARLRFAQVSLRVGRSREGLHCLAAGPRVARLGLDRARSFLTGRLQLAEGDVELARRSFERVVRPDGGEEPVEPPAPGDVRAEAWARWLRLRLDTGDPAAKAALRLAVDRWSKGPPAGVPVERVLPVLGLLASCELTHGEAERAGRLLDLALREARASGDPDLLVEPLNERAVFEAGRGRTGAAIGLFEEIEGLARDRGDLPAEMRAVYNRALATYRLGRLQEAEALHRQAVRLSESIGRHAFSATVWVGLAVVLRERGSLLEALRLYRRVLRRPSLARPADVVLAHNNLGEIYLAMGRPVRSERERRAAVALARELGHRFLLGVSWRSLGASLWALGRSREAREALDACLEAERGAADPRHIASGHLFLACLDAWAGDFRGAGRHLRLAARGVRASRERVFDEGLRLLRAELLALRGRRRAAVRLLERDGANEGAPPPFWPVPSQAIRIRTSADWPSAPASRKLLSCLRAGEREGRVWQTFLATVVALRDPRLPPPARRSLENRRELLLALMARGATPAQADAQRHYWVERPPGLGREPAIVPVASAATDSIGSSPAPTGGEPEAATWAGSLLNDLRRGDLSPGPTAIERVLSALASSLEGGAAWWVESLTPGAGVLRAEGAGPPPAVLLRAISQVSKDSVAGGGLESTAGGRLLRTGRAGWLLVSRSPSERGRRARSGERERVSATALLIGVLRESASSRDGLERERELHRGARESLRLAASGTTADRELLETEGIARREELVAAARAGDLPPPDAARPPVAESRPLRDLMSRLPRIAEGGLPVLILGESGVGKDHLARWIHSLSPWRAGPFLAELCDLPDSLLETELFGCVRGAFTGAEADRPGLLQRAEGGTLYLDEVSDLCADLQAHLLRVIETRRVRPVGGDREIPLVFRLISSSRRGGREELLRAGLRADLYYRLQGQEVVIPPLRERPEDVERLTQVFVSDFARRTGTPPAYVSDRALRRLLRYPWPGNVRELRNEVERALIENPRELVEDLLLRGSGAEGVTERSRAEPSGDLDLRSARAAFERDLVSRALRLAGGNVAAAARALGVTRRYLNKLLEKLALDRRDFLSGRPRN